VLRKQFLLTNEEFEEYYKESLRNIIGDKQKSENKRLVIVGGQSGAGKTRLIPIVNTELNNNGVVVDFDILRSYHPAFEEVSKAYIEKTHIILHPDVEKVKNRIMAYLMENSYDVIYEGSLRNTQGFIDFSQDFLKKGYSIGLYIMAVPELESFGSIFERYAEDLLDNNNPRWVEKIAHDESYIGVLKTVEEFEKQKICSDTKVFTRGKPDPKEIYSSKVRQFPTINEAIQYGRNKGRKQAIKGFWKKYRNVYQVLKRLKPELIDNLKDWEDLFKKEYKENSLDNRKQK